MTTATPEGITMTDTDTTEHDEATCLFCKAGEPMAHNYEPDNGNDQARPTVAEYVAQHGITVTITSDLGIRTVGPQGDDWVHHAYRLTMRRPGARPWTHIAWHAGTGITTRPDETPADVFDSLLGDGFYVAELASFADWCDELGYDTDSRRALNLYRKCERTWERMHEFLGSEGEAYRVATNYERL